MENANRSFHLEYHTMQQFSCLITAENVQQISALNNVNKYSFFSTIKVY